MARARRNPIGLAVNSQLVKVGKGEHTHIYNPKKGTALCQSGKNAGKKGGSGAKPALFQTSARYATCYRCIKLAELNMRQGREPWDDGKG